MTYHPVGEQLLEAEHAVLVRFEQALDGHVGHLGDDLRDDLRRHLGPSTPASTGAGKVDDRDGFVGQSAPRQVPHGPPDRQRQRILGVAHAMVLLEARSERIQHEVRILAARLLYVDDREASGERKVDLDRLLVLLRGRGADARQLAAREGHLEVRGDLVGAVAREQLMYLVEEEDDAPSRGENLLANLCKSLRQRAAHARSRQKLGDRKLDDDAVVERDDLLGARDARCERADDAGLSDPRRADEAGIIALALGKDVQRLLDLEVATHHRVELAFGGREGEVLTQRSNRRKLLWIESEAGRRGRPLRPTAARGDLPRLPGRLGRGCFRRFIRQGSGWLRDRRRGSWRDQWNRRAGGPSRERGSRVARLHLSFVAGHDAPSADEPEPHVHGRNSKTVHVDAALIEGPMSGRATIAEERY